MVGVLMTAACTFDIRVVQIIDSDGAAGAAGQGGMGGARDASQEASDARAGAGGAAGDGGRSDASVDGKAGAGGSGGAAGRGGAAGGSGSGGAAGKGGSSGTGGTGGTGGAAGAAGAAGLGGAAGVAGLGGAAGVAGLGAGGTSGGAGGADGGMTAGAAGQTGGRDGGMDARDIWVVDTNIFDAPPDGGIVVFFEENFDSALGTFTVENNCGSPPVWSNNAGYAHAPDPAILGISSLHSPSVTVPPNVSEIHLRLSHKFGTEMGYHGGQLLVSVNSGTPAMVTTFTTGPYVNGTNVNADTCTALTIPSSFYGWSGDLTEFESEVNLSAAPFNVAAGNTVAIRFRMLTDNVNAGNGWDINWVRLSGYAQ